MDFETRRRNAKEEAMRKAERDRQRAVREVDVSFPVREDGCALCGKTVHGLLAHRRTRLAAVVCHPWGPLGGSMRDMTVSRLLKTLGEGAGITTLRFNFRSGLGRGHSSAADVRAACAFLSRELREVQGILLIGYSYGASVVASVVAEIAEVCAFVLVAPPLDYNNSLFMGRQIITPALKACKKPKLLICGDSDQFCGQES
ncbi:MAG: hypothetical protein SGPRY_010341 [Prymnesium sp.]